MGPDEQGVEVQLLECGLKKRHSKELEVSFLYWVQKQVICKMNSKAREPPAFILDTKSFATYKRDLMRW